MTDNPWLENGSISLWVLDLCDWQVIVMWVVDLYGICDWSVVIWVVDLYGISDLAGLNFKGPSHGMCL